MQFYTLSQQSLTKTGGSSVVEEYIPLWMADGTTASYSGGISSGSTFLLDGSGWGSSGNSSKLHTLNSNWFSGNKFALECTVYVTSGYTANFSLWDFTSSSLVSASQIATTSTTAIVIRSPQFTLTPGHIYGVTAWFSSMSASAYWYISDASLVVFGQ